MPRVLQVPGFIALGSYAPLLQIRDIVAFLGSRLLLERYEFGLKTHSNPATLSVRPSISI